MLSIVEMVLSRVRITPFPPDPICRKNNVDNIFILRPPLLILACQSVHALPQT